MPTDRASPRLRLTTAMVTVAARYGYREASVARVLAEAGVSRATFYRHFENKEACFLAAYREIVQRLERAVEEFDGESPSGRTRTRELLAQLLENADREPAAARVFLLESLAAGPQVRAEHERFLDAAERALEAALNAAPGGAPQLQIPARSLLGGIGSVVAIRVFRGETGGLVGLLDELEAWVRSHAVVGGSRLCREDWARLGSDLGGAVELEPTSLGDRLPRGRTALAPAVVASEQRQRILAATARAAGEKGYEAMTVADVVATAGIAREAFYEQFRSKEDAFLAAQAYALETSVSFAAAQFFSEDSWPDRVWNAILALLHYFASVPDLAVLDVIESYSVGPAAVRRSFESRMAFTLFLEDGYRWRPEVEHLPRLTSEAIAGAILEMLRRETVDGRVAQAQELTPSIVYLALAPFVGPEKAMRLIEEKIAATRPGRPSGRSRARQPGG